MWKRVLWTRNPGSLGLSPNFAAYLLGSMEHVTSHSPLPCSGFFLFELEMMVT